MAVPTGDYISDLDATKPNGATEDANLVDDWLKYIQKCVKQSFPNITGEVTATQDELNALVSNGVSATTFATVSDMDAATELTVGAFVETEGYYAAGDGGGNSYEIVAAGTGTDDGGSYITLSGSGLQAKGLFPDGRFHLRQYGAKGDGVTDDTVAIQLCINKAGTRYGSTVDGLGYTYAISSTVTVQGMYNIHLTNLRLDALGTAASWGTGVGGVMLRLLQPTAGYTGSWPVTLNSHKITHIKIDGNRVAGTALYCNKAGSYTTITHFAFYGFTEYGLWIEATGDGLAGTRIENGTVSECAWSDVTWPDYDKYSDYANRTATGIYVKSASDMDFINVVSFLNKVQLAFATGGGQYSNSFTTCKFWGNMNAAGASTATLVDIPVDSGRGMRFVGCRFDDADLRIKEFSHTFTGCRFIQNSNVRLIATTAGEDGDGLTFIGCVFSHGERPISLETEGSGTWVDSGAVKVRFIGNATNASDEIGFYGRKTAFGGEWGIGNNNALVGGPLDYFGINNRTGLLATNSDNFSTGLTISKWGNDDNYPFVIMGKSRSDTIGTLGSVPQANDVLGYIGFTGDMLTHMGNQTYQRTGAYIEASVTGAGWNSSSFPTTMKFATTPYNGTGNAIVRFSLWSDGTLAPSADNAYDFGASTVRWKDIWMGGAIQTSDARIKTEVADESLGLDFIQSLRPVSYKYTVAQNIPGQEVVSEAVTDEEGNILEEPVIEETLTPVAGVRKHHGLIAQEVQSALTAAGLDGSDFAGWILSDLDDPDSEQALRYSEFIAPLIKAVQELAARVEALEAP